ncbi:unnamed protein product [Agarophyton chilense]|eukprot:gb/GEZJ01001166.1/.p1 GENE.gb/GEZJ01001166.1/~~gb/GEZJ01001166.1/.p1  ORF type:complete len:411 (-),score=76.85 gb/GEZJ01001166.1/:443-1675(-)
MEDERWLMMAVLHHLKAASKREGMHESALEEAVFAISNAYSLNMRNAATMERYPLDNLSLVDVFKAGRKQLLQQRSPTGSAPRSTALNGQGEQTDAANGKAQGFDHFLKRLKESTSLFEGLEEHSPEYERRVQRARQKFESRRAAKRVKASHAAASGAASTLSKENEGGLGADSIKDNAEALKKEGNMKLKENKYEEALAVYNECIALWPDNAVYHSNRAAANMLLERFDEAEADCRRAIERDANFLRPRERLAHVYRVLGRTADEVLALREALKVDGSKQSIKSRLQDAENRLVGSGGTSGAGTGEGEGGDQTAPLPSLANLMGGANGNFGEMISRMGRDGVSNMANMMGINVPGEALDDLFENGGLQQMQTMLSENPEMVQQTMQRMMRGELPTPFGADGAGRNGGGG